MIYTVTLNPALDRFILVEQLLTEDTNRIISETPYAAGKGIDVSRVIRELGGQSVALGLVGGFDGFQLEGLLINAGVMTAFTRISGETRTNIILREKTKGHQKGIPYILVSRGKEGLLLYSSRQKIRATAPPVKVDSTVGAGDSVVGGFVLAHGQGKDLADCLRIACAAGTATAKTPGTGLCHRMNVEEILTKVKITDL